jgi:hypothetical protein
LLALSDHDTVAGVAEANAAAARAGIVNVAATELSAIDPDHVDVHILGYLIDPEDAAFGQRLDPFNRGPQILGLPGGFPVIFSVFSASLLVGALLILKVPEVRKR